jgi:hypothetical protein
MSGDTHARKKAETPQAAKNGVSQSDQGRILDRASHRRRIDGQYQNGLATNISISRYPFGFVIDAGRV